MKVLVVKLTSLGDLLHLMPALSDLKSNIDDLQVDWMVEDSFREVPEWHPAVHRAIPVATRRWRKLNWQIAKEFIAFVRDIRRDRYDIIVDAQGLLKSAVLSRFAKLCKQGHRIGFSANSIKEKPAAKFYHKKIDVPREQHAIDRLRQLFAQGFEYSLVYGDPNYSLELPVAKNLNSARRSVLFLHGTTWSTKHLPERSWIELVDLAIEHGFQVKLGWGNQVEKLRAERIANDRSNALVLPRTNLLQIATELQSSAGVVAVDTGLGHLAAALGIPAVSVYGATDSSLTGTIGRNQAQLQSTYPCSPCLLRECDKLTEHSNEPPCYQILSSSDIWQRLSTQMTQAV